MKLTFGLVFILCVLVFLPASLWLDDAPRAEAAPASKASRAPLWERVMSDRRKMTDRLLGQADALLTKQQFAQAAALLEKAISSRPFAAELWFALGTVHSHAERFGDCVEALRKSRSLDPKFQSNLVSFRLGLCLSLSGRIAEGIREYRKVTATGGVGGEVLNWNLGDSLMALGRLEEAISRYQAALQLNPMRQVLHFALAVALDRQGQWEASNRRMKVALGLDPAGKSLDSSDILWLPPYEHLYYRALIHLARGARAQALDHYLKFHQAAPRSPWRFVMRLRGEGLRSRPVEALELQAQRGPLDAEKAALAISGRQSSLRACLGTLPERWALQELKGVSLAITLQQGKAAQFKVSPLVGEVRAAAQACLQKELGLVRWAGALKGREPAAFTVELVGP
ncbi:MAG: tetratricopeptide repeat protein [Polyangia bacterium]|jgi:tetratricopeptide (TPR) repeat protein|nr:tetratricopeptide repeat protein [Polyangia bacterium]